MAESTPKPKAKPEEKNILIFEDDEHVRQMLQFAIAAEGFQVRTAANGSQALKMALEPNAHLVLTDIMMPGGGGYDVVRDLRSDPMTREIPILIMTGRDFDTSTKYMFEQEPNVKGFLNKPISHYRLVGMIHDLLQTLSKDEQARLDAEKNQPDLDDPRLRNW